MGIEKELSYFHFSEETYEVTPHNSLLRPIVKVVSAGCNLNCTYCFYSGYQSEIRKMDDKVLEVVIRRFLDYSPDVTFYWHGGEPLLAGLEFYERAVELQRKLAKPGQRIRNCIQTNATIIDENWAKFFKQEGFGVGISLDGPKEIHDLVRVNFAGEGSFYRVKRSVDILRDQGIDFGAIAVLSKFSLNFLEDIFKFMYENKISFSANPCFPSICDTESVRKITITAREYTDALLRLLDLWLEKDDENFRIRPLEDIVKGLLGGRPSLCRFQGSCSRFISVDYNGDVYPCDEFLNQDYFLGNIVCYSLQSLFGSDGFLNYYLGREEILAKCLGCKWFRICQGGCMREWEGRKNGFEPEQMDYCKERKRLFEGVGERLKNWDIR